MATDTMPLLTEQEEYLMQRQQDLPATGFLRLRDVLRFYPVSKSTWWAGVQSGRFPKPVKLSERTTAWKTEDIRDLIERVNTNATN